MREIKAQLIEEAVVNLIIQASYELPDDILNALNFAYEREDDELAKDALKVLLENARIAKEQVYPLCQDTGMAFVFLEIGQEVMVTNGGLREAINNGVAKAYQEGFLRKSIVADPILRVNTRDNRPAIIYIDIVEGDSFSITVAPKGFGAENQSGVRMFTPKATPDEIVEYIVDGVINSGSKGCPPGVLGVGIGGSFDYATFLAKKALLLPINVLHEEDVYASMEEDLIKRLNASGIGVMGLGGQATLLGARIIAHPTHIAGLPVAYNYCCHALRHATVCL